MLTGYRFKTLSVMVGLCIGFSIGLSAWASMGNISTTTLRLSSTSEGMKIENVNKPNDTLRATSESSNTCSGPDSEARLCDQFLDIAKGQMQNFMQLVNHYHKGEGYGYTAYFNFHTINQNNVPSHKQCNPNSIDTCYEAPTTQAKEGLYNLLDTLNTSNLNYLSHLVNEVTGGYMPYSAPVEYFPVKTNSGSPYLVKELSVLEGMKTAAGNQNQFGGGGGFGCVVGYKSKSGDGGLLNPVFQFGGGFGKGYALADGLDFGFGGGSSLCDATVPGGLCQQMTEPNAFGGGGGVNQLQGKSFYNGDEQPLSSQYQNALSKAFGGKSASEDDIYYVACSLGGGTGFQTVPENSTQTTHVYQQPFGFGGGGYYLAIFAKCTGSRSTSVRFGRACK